MRTKLGDQQYSHQGFQGPLAAGPQVRSSLLTLLAAAFLPSTAAPHPASAPLPRTEASLTTEGAHAETSDLLRFSL